MRLVPLGRVRRDAIGGEAARELLDLALVACEIKLGGEVKLLGNVLPCGQQRR